MHVTNMPSQAHESERDMIDMAKKYTFQGVPVRVICTDRQADFDRNIVVLRADHANNSESVLCCRPDQLEEVPPDVIVWANVYPTGRTGAWVSSPEHAQERGDDRRIGLIELNMTQRTSTWHEVEK